MLSALKHSIAFQIYSRSTEAERTLFYSCMFSICLVGFRVVYTGRPLFLSMVWNLFLAFIPYVISRVLNNKKKQISGTLLAFISIIWLLFIPNSFYIITDLFHLERKNEVPLWFDLALLFSVAWNGLLMGILSVGHMEQIIEERMNKKLHFVFLYFIMFLNALGIFLGRYLRYNSWDIVDNPLSLVHDIIYLFIHPIRNRFDWGMIICYSILLTMIYVTLKRISRSMGR